MVFSDNFFSDNFKLVSDFWKKGVGYSYLGDEDPQVQNLNKPVFSESCSCHLDFWESRTTNFTNIRQFAKKYFVFTCCYCYLLFLTYNFPSAVQHVIFLNNQPLIAHINSVT